MDQVGAPVYALPDQEPLSAEQWEQIARFLFDVLDNIDTALDVAKSNHDVYRNLVQIEHLRRFEVASTDGHRVVFRARRSTPPGPEGEA